MNYYGQGDDDDPGDDEGWDDIDPTTFNLARFPRFPTIFTFADERDGTPGKQVMLHHPATVANADFWQGSKNHLLEILGSWIQIIQRQKLANTENRKKWLKRFEHEFKAFDSWDADHICLFACKKQVFALHIIINALGYITNRWQDIQRKSKIKPKLVRTSESVLDTAKNIALKKAKELALAVFWSKYMPIIIGGFVGYHLLIGWLHKKGRRI